MLPIMDPTQNGNSSLWYLYDGIPYIDKRTYLYGTCALIAEDSEANTFQNWAWRNSVWGLADVPQAKWIHFARFNFLSHFGKQEVHLQTLPFQDDVMTWIHFQVHLTFVWAIFLVDSPHEGLAVKNFDAFFIVSMNKLLNSLSVMETPLQSCYVTAELINDLLPLTRFCVSTPHSVAGTMNHLWWICTQIHLWFLWRKQ